MKFHNPLNSENQAVQLIAFVLLFLTTTVTIIAIPEIFFSVLFVGMIARIIYYIFKGK